MIVDFSVVKTSTGEVVDTFSEDTDSWSNQEFLRLCIVDVLEREHMGEINLSTLNKYVWHFFKEDIKSRDIEWTWQHLIASARKHLVDNKTIKRDVVDGVTWFSI